MAIEWTQDLATGINWQDNQHKELFVKINSLIEAMKTGKGKEEIVKLFKFLDDYTVFHFGNEEKAMEKFNYNDYSSHKSQHQKFISNISDLKKQLETAVVPVAVVIKAQSMVVDWLKTHIGNVDKVLGAFLKTKA